MCAQLNRACGRATLSSFILCVLNVASAPDVWLPGVFSRVFTETGWVIFRPRAAWEWIRAKTQKTWLLGVLISTADGFAKWHINTCANGTIVLGSIARGYLTRVCIPTGVLCNIWLQHACCTGKAGTCSTIHVLLNIPVWALSLVTWRSQLFSFGGIVAVKTKILKWLWVIGHIPLPYKENMKRGTAVQTQGCGSWGAEAERLLWWLGQPGLQRKSAKQSEVCFIVSPKAYSLMNFEISRHTLWTSVRTVFTKSLKRWRSVLGFDTVRECTSTSSNLRPGLIAPGDYQSNLHPDIPPSSPPSLFSPTLLICLLVWCMSLWMWMCACHHTHVEVRGQLARISSLFLPCGFPGPNSCPCSAFTYWTI